MKTTTGAALKSLVCTAVAAFVKMYGQYWKGKERYTRLLLAWYTCMSQYPVCGTDVGDTALSSLIQGYTRDVNAYLMKC